MNTEGKYRTAGIPVLLAALLASALSCKGSESTDLGRKTPGTVYVADRKGLNLREGPAVSGRRIAAIPLNQELTVLESGKNEETVAGRKGTWLKVRWSGKTGWVFSAFCTEKPPADRPVPATGKCGEFTDSFFSGNFSKGELRNETYVIRLESDHGATLDMYDHILKGKWSVKDCSIEVRCVHRVLSPRAYECREGGVEEREFRACMEKAGKELAAKYGKSDFTIPVVYLLFPNRDGTVRVEARGRDTAPAAGKETFTYRRDETWSCAR